MENQKGFKGVHGKNGFNSEGNKEIDQENLSDDAINSIEDNTESSIEEERDRELENKNTDHLGAL